MPELPEVETICRQLDKVLTGQRVKALQGPTLQVRGKKILGVKRKAKMIIIELSGGESLLIHLKMTGQLLYEENNKFLISNIQKKYTRVIITLDKGKVFFNDLRKFGWIKLVTRGQLLELSKKLPPDVVDKEFTLNYLRKILTSSGQALKIVLLDQQKMGGIGNIYVNEILFCAKINPRKLTRDIYGTQVRYLHRCIKKIINAGIKYGGTTAADKGFINAFGQSGKFQKYLKVYENKGNCHQCKTKIIKIKLGGRGTYYCPECQK